MKALTLHQPWATLVAAGVKRIETRSWSTKYRGPLAIHAAMRDPNKPSLGGTWTIGDWFVVSQCEPYYWELRQGARRVPLPLGAIVATCDLVDVVPIVGLGDRVSWGDPYVAWWKDDPTRPDRSLHVWEEDEAIEEITDQAPFGDFTHGRYAWLLDNIVALDEPIPARGRQRLWTMRVALGDSDNK